MQYIKPEITTALELYDEADNLAKDYLINSFGLKEEDYEIARLRYQKACKERLRLAKRLEFLTRELTAGNAIGFESVGSILARTNYDFPKGGSKSES